MSPAPASVAEDNSPPPLTPTRRCSVPGAGSSQRSWSRWDPRPPPGASAPPRGPRGRRRCTDGRRNPRSGGTPASPPPARTAGPLLAFSLPREPPPPQLLLPEGSGRPPAPPSGEGGPRATGTVLLNPPTPHPAPPRAGQGRCSLCDPRPRLQAGRGARSWRLRLKSAHPNREGAGGVGGGGAAEDGGVPATCSPS